MPLTQERIKVKEIITIDPLHMTYIKGDNVKVSPFNRLIIDENSIVYENEISNFLFYVHELDYSLC